MLLYIRVGIIILVALAISLLVMLQPSKDGNSLSGLGGGSDSKLFSTNKKRGIESVLFNATVVLGILFFVLLIIF